MPSRYRPSQLRSSPSAHKTACLLSVGRVFPWPPPRSCATRDAWKLLRPPVFSPGAALAATSLARILLAHGGRVDGEAAPGGSRPGGRRRPEAISSRPICTHSSKEGICHRPVENIDVVSRHRRGGVRPVAVGCPRWSQDTCRQARTCPAADPAAISGSAGRRGGWGAWTRSSRPSLR